MATRTQTASSTRTARQPRKTAPVEQAQQTVAERAYTLFLARGEAHGDDVADWLTAERELSGATDAGVPS